MISFLRNIRSRYASKTWFRKNYREFRQSESATIKRFALREEDFFPCIGDNTPHTGFDRHYVYHVAWAVRVVKAIAPEFHTDISSSLHFCTTLSAFIPVKFYDYRPAQLNLDQLTYEPSDLLHLPFPSDSIASLSCLHTVEHVGLGRYGEPIDYDGDLKAIRELKRVVERGGHLLFVTPVGKPKIVYNAHRIYSWSQIIEVFNGFELKEFSLVPDKEADGGLIRGATREMADQQNYGCGCFWFVKRTT